MEYICSKCGAGDCKLWRAYQSFNPRLLCAPCAAEEQNKDITQMDEHGLFPIEGQHHGKTDQIGWYIPAVATAEGNFWGYTSVPTEDAERWLALPTLPENHDEHV